MTAQELIAHLEAKPDVIDFPGIDAADAVGEMIQSLPGATEAQKARVVENVRAAPILRLTRQHHGGYAATTP